MAINNTLTLIQAVTVGSGGAASIGFTSIPQTYTDLVVKMSARSTNSGAVYEYANITFNGVSANFSAKNIQGDGAAAASNTYASNIYVMQDGSTATASTFGNGEFYIPNYTGSSFKPLSMDSVMANNATNAYLELTAGLWSNTAAITSILLTPLIGTAFSEHSTAYLYGVATAATSAKAVGGDIITQDADYFYHIFTSSGTFNPTSTLTCDLLVVAGGGGGGGAHGGGGGAGGLVAYSSQTITAGAKTVTVGGGGAGGSNARGTTGTNSQFASLTASDGGGGGGSSGTAAGLSGGSGGGAGGTLTGAGGTATSGQGFDGGLGSVNANGGGGGGGGGAGRVGFKGESQGTTSQGGGQGGNGGDGTDTYSSWFVGFNGFIAGGGGGGSYGSPSFQDSSAVGGRGGGGTGGNARYSPQGVTVGITNTGSGGGGGSGNGGNGAAGGSGVIVVKYAK